MQPEGRTREDGSSWQIDTAAAKLARAAQTKEQSTPEQAQKRHDI